MKKFLCTFVLGFISIGLVFYFFTLESFQFIEISKMKLYGAKEISSPEYHYFEKNNCADSKNCQCVLLLHGLGDFALTWEKILTTNKNEFAENIHFFAPDLTVSNDTVLKDRRLKKIEDFNIQKTAMRISDFFLPQCDSWVVVGNSFGAWMSVFMSLKSEKIKGLLLLGPAGLKKDYSHITGYFLNPDVKGAKNFYHKLYFKTQNVPDFIFRRVVERIKNQTVVEQLKSVTENDYLDKYLGQIKVPVFYVWGEADGVIPPKWGNEFQALTPGSQLDILNECGHVPQKECTEKVVKKLNQLLHQLSNS